MFNPLLQQWRQSTGIPLPSKKLPIVEFFNVPLLFEPGSSYMYSSMFCAEHFRKAINSVQLDMISQV